MDPSFALSLNDAFREARAILSRHFSWRRWLALSLLAWLSVLGFIVANSPWDALSGGRAAEWVQANLLARPRVLAAVTGLVLAMALFFAWIRARALMALLDCLVRRDAGAREAWRRQARAGGILFLMRLGVGTAVAVAVGALATAWFLWFHFRELAWDALATDDALFLGLLFAFGIWVTLAFCAATCLVDDFGSALLMNGKGFRGAMRGLREVISRNAISVMAYVLVRFCLGLVALSAVLVVGLLSCGLAFLPYLGTLVLLPVHAVWRLYPIFFLRTIGFDPWGEGGAPLIQEEAQEPALPPRLIPPRLAGL